jgi:cell division protein FtsW
MISGAFLINSFGISGIIPIKGIAVPFLSYGGSSLLSIAIAMGLVLSISREVPKEEISQNNKKENTELDLVNGKLTLEEEEEYYYQRSF